MLPPKRFVQVIAIFLLGIQGLAFLGIIEACAQLRRAFRRRAAGSIGAGDSAIPPTSHSSSGGSFASK
jgi:hypothetical protein